MKIRQGFVSNSSTSSFIILGINLDNHPDLKDKYIQGKGWECEVKDGVDLPENVDVYSYDDYGTLLGWECGGGDDCDFGFSADNVQELADFSTEFEKSTGIKPEFFSGIRAS